VKEKPKSSLVGLHPSTVERRAARLTPRSSRLGLRLGRIGLGGSGSVPPVGVEDSDVGRREELEEALRQVETSIRASGALILAVSRRRT
jgi:hypothetical protein